MISEQALEAYSRAAPALLNLSHEDATMVVRSLAILIPPPPEEPAEPEGPSNE